MRALKGLAVVAVLTVAGGVSAEEVKSGVPVGGRVTSYSTTKVCGIEDGVKAGKSLCYT